MSHYERIKDFRINLTPKRELGPGSQGTVYPGINLITNDQVAAKRRRIFKEFFNKEEFETEADLLLHRIPPHENIIKVYDFTKTEYEKDGIPMLDLWLITELCELGNLNVFAFKRDSSIEQKIEIMYQSALAVRHLHGCKPESIAHRDVKPENILVSGSVDNPTIKLCDFGSANSVMRERGKSVTMVSLAGTKLYQAPEQVELDGGQFSYNKQEDIFSLGITFLAILKAVKGSLMSPETLNEKGLGETMWMKHKQKQHFKFSVHTPSNSAPVRAIKHIIEKMIEFEPSSRLSADEVVEEFSKLRFEHPPPPLAPSSVCPPAPSTAPQLPRVRQSAPDLTTQQSLLATSASARLSAPAVAPLPLPARGPRRVPVTVARTPPTETWPPGTKVIAVSSYTATDKHEMSFQKYDVLTIIKKTKDQNRYKAKDKSGKTGVISGESVRKMKREVQLHPMKWYHGNLSRQEACIPLSGKQGASKAETQQQSLALTSDKGVGTFLVRARDQDVPSSHPDHQYTLDLVGPDKSVRHVRIFKQGCMLTTDRKNLFENLLQLVQFYTKGANGLCTKLKKPLAFQGDLSVCVDPRDFLEEGWYICQSKIHILDKYYAGKFTDIHIGEYSGVICFIQKQNDPYSVQDTLIEAAIMSGLSHKNVVQLIGVVLGEETLIVTEYLGKGRLSDYLQSRGRNGITSQDQLNFARDVCEGMHYLEQKNIVHRKLMAQSVLVSVEGTAKVGDFTLAHPVGQQKGVQEVQIRWAAPEILVYEHYSSKSDLWSFDVLLWEIYTFGCEPYDGILTKDVPPHVLGGGRLQSPEGCPAEIYHVMSAAWDKNPTKRPTFSDFCRILELKGVV